jgi:hypothetical protein
MDFIMLFDLFLKGADILCVCQFNRTCICTYPFVFVSAFIHIIYVYVYMPTYICIYICM